jgi:hypothetical protein
VRRCFIVAADSPAHAAGELLELLLTFRHAGNGYPGLVISRTCGMNNKRGGADTLQLLRIVQIIELDEGDARTSGPDNDVLAGHHLLPVRKGCGMSDGGRSYYAGQLFA